MPEGGTICSKYITLFFLRVHCVQCWPYPYDSSLKLPTSWVRERAGRPYPRLRGRDLGGSRGARAPPRGPRLASATPPSHTPGPARHSRLLSFHLNVPRSMTISVGFVLASGQHREFDDNCWLYMIDDGRTLIRFVN